MAYMYGTVIRFEGNDDHIILKCPIKSIRYAYGSATLVQVDSVNFSFAPQTPAVKFNSINGYPGVKLSVGNISAPIALIIEEIGDVLNPNYFKEDIRNWNGQGATVASESSEASKKAEKSKKAEVSE